MDDIVQSKVSEALREKQTQFKEMQKNVTALESTNNLLQQ
jgi:hypothetical protein